jgi:ribosomal protein S18 acetylase RimI-like enzyme
MVALRPLASDPDRARTLVRRALETPARADAELRQFLDAIERAVENGSAEGALRSDGNRVVGVAVWEKSSALGATLQVLYLDDGRRSAAEYRRFVVDIRERSGPIAFAPSPLLGLTASEESVLMVSLGFAPYARSEMRRELTASAPALPSDEPVRTRSAGPEDLPALARLYEAAYRGQFDRYLFFASSNALEDAVLATREILSGRWGEFLPWASPVIEDEGEVRAAVLTVRGPAGPLLADVMVDPRSAGRGRGRAAVLASLRALRDRGETAATLAVTEGNERALRLYRRLGFVRSQGPTSGWYSRERIPIPPGATQAAVATEAGSSSTWGR